MVTVIILSVMGTMWALGVVALFFICKALPTGEPIGLRDALEIVLWPITAIYAIVIRGRYQKQHKKG